MEKDNDEYHEWRWPIPTAMLCSWFFKALNRHLAPLTRSWRTGSYHSYYTHMLFDGGLGEVTLLNDVGMVRILRSGDTPRRNAHTMYSSGSS